MSTRSARNRFLVAFVVAFSLATCALLIGGFHGTTLHDQTRMVSNHFAAQRATLDWPVKPPVYWPAPSQVYRARGPLVEYFNAIRGTDHESTHQMEVYRYGWPMAVLEHRRQWWPWDDPTYATDIAPNSGLVVLWANLLFSASAIGVLFGTIHMAIGLVVRRHWRSKECCAKCGYELCNSSRCSECGVARERRGGELPAAALSPATNERRTRVPGAQLVRRAYRSHWWSLVRFVVAVIAAIVALLIGGFHGTTLHDQTRMVSNHFAAQRATLDWPVKPPVYWPAPSQVYHARGPLVEYFNAIRGTAHESTHQMEVYRYGWPIPVLEHRRQFWPWDDPTFATDIDHDSGLVVLWANLLLPAITAGVFVGATDMAIRSVFRIHRRRKGRCVTCGYTLRDLSRCPECGAKRERGG